MGRGGDDTGVEIFDELFVQRLASDDLYDDSPIDLSAYAGLIAAAARSLYVDGDSADLVKLLQDHPELKKPFCRNESAVMETLHTRLMVSALPGSGNPINLHDYLRNQALALGMTGTETKLVVPLYAHDDSLPVSADADGSLLYYHLRLPYTAQTICGIPLPAGTRQSTRRGVFTAALQRGDACWACASATVPGRFVPSIRQARHEVRSFSIGPDIYEQRVRRNLTDSVSDFLRQKEDLDPARLITAAQQHAREQAPKPTAELLAHQLKVQQSPWINEHHLLRIDDAGEHLLGTVGPLVATVVDTRANLWIPEEKELEEIFDLLWQAHADGRIEPGDETRLAFLAIALCMRDPSLARRAQQATGNKDRGFTLFSAFIDQHMAKEPLTSVPSR